MLGSDWCNELVETVIIMTMGTGRRCDHHSSTYLQDLDHFSSTDVLLEHLESQYSQCTSCSCVVCFPDLQLVLSPCWLPTDKVADPFSELSEDQPRTY